MIVAVTERLRVRIVLLPTADGGRRTGIGSGYRPSWRGDRKPEWNDAAIELDGTDRLEPGEEAMAWLLLGVPEHWKGRVQPGDVLEAAEGSRLVARADVLALE
jgi:hypothetical protein